MSTHGEMNGYDMDAPADVYRLWGTVVSWGLMKQSRPEGAVYTYGPLTDTLM